jgi:CO/xanthine dehydrogenase FAD-binding subunit
MNSLHKFEYHTPQTLEQAWALFQENPGAVFLAGGTDYIPLLKKDLKNAEQVIGLHKIPYLQKVEKRADNLFIGAMQTLSGFMRDPLVSEHFAALARAASLVASPQIRNVGTLGGNILQDRRCIYFNQSANWRQSIDPCFKNNGRLCHQVPSSPSCRAIYHSDLAPVLLALEAQVEYFNRDGFSLKPIKELVHEHVTLNGRMERGNNFITGFLVPLLPHGAWLQFVKQSARASLDFAVINAALCHRPQIHTGPGFDVKLIVGAVTSEPIELSETESFIQKQSSAPTLLKEPIIEKALAEIDAKCALIRDTGVSLKCRKNAFGAIGRLIAEWHNDLTQRRGDAENIF